MAGIRKMKAIVTVVGKDSVGIIAGVCQILAEFGINNSTECPQERRSELLAGLEKLR